jgi:hypothetical protein
MQKRGPMTINWNACIAPDDADQDLAASYAAMAADDARESEAHLWTEALVNDVSEEPNSDPA